MSSSQKPPPDLLSLPNEILARICFYAEDEDDFLTKSLRWLKAVRLTCKQLYFPATTEFVKLYLQHPEVKLSRHGLQEFAELCKHPLFGPYVQDISFDACRLDSKFVQKIGAQMDSLITENKFEAVKQAREYLDWYLLKLEEELWFEESGDMSVLLQEVFAALRLYRNPIDLTVSTSFESWSRLHPIGHKNSIAGHPANDKLDHCCAFACRGFSTVLVTVFKLAATAGCNIRHLFIDKNYLDQAQVSNDPVNLDSQSRTALNDLESLSLSIGEHDYTKDVDKTLETFVSQAKKLKRFQFWLNENEEYESDEKLPASSSIDYTSQIFKMLNSDALRQAGLSYIAVYDAELLAMLTTHQRTLKELTFSDVTLAGSWNRVLLYIRDKCCLERFVIVNATQTHEDDIEEGGYGEIWIDGGVELNGEEKVTCGLTDVLSQKGRQRTDSDFTPDWEYANSIRTLMTMSRLRG